MQMRGDVLAIEVVLIEYICWETTTSARNWCANDGTTTQIIIITTDLTRFLLCKSSLEKTLDYESRENRRTERKKGSRWIIIGINLPPQLLVRPQTNKFDTLNFNWLHLASSARYMELILWKKLSNVHGKKSCRHLLVCGALSSTTARREIVVLFQDIFRGTHPNPEPNNLFGPYFPRGFCCCCCCSMLSQ